MTCTDLQHTISFSNTSPNVGDTITCVATIINNGTTPEGFRVAFSADGIIFYTSPSQSLNPGDTTDVVADYHCINSATISLCADIVCETFAAQTATYISQNPSKTMISYPWEPITKVRVMPNGEVPAAPGDFIFVSGCADQFCASSFVIKALKDINDITISPPALANGVATIDSTNVNIRLVKVWWRQSDSDIENSSYPISSGLSFYLRPGLLLKDDALISVDVPNKMNYIRARYTESDADQYLDITTPTAPWTGSEIVRDSETLQPFSLKANENKQVWITTHIPAGTSPGVYNGDIIVSAPGEPSVTVRFGVEVLPFELESSPLIHSIYYHGRLREVSGTTSPHIDKTEVQYLADLQNLKNHGVLYPDLYEPLFDPPNDYTTTISRALYLRDQVGFPKDHIFVRGMSTGKFIEVSPYKRIFTAAELAIFEAKLVQYVAMASTYGYIDFHIYGLDEATGTLLTGEIPTWNAVHSHGVKIFVSCYGDACFNAVGNILDVPIISEAWNPSLVNSWHGAGKKAFSVGNPQSGVENPVVYRDHYGFGLWLNGYDGASTYAFQHCFGWCMWNDWDSAARNSTSARTYRNHTYAFSTKDGLVDSIGWEGYTEAVNDVRYVETLVQKRGNDVVARRVVEDALLQISSGKAISGATIRKQIVDQILDTNNSIVVNSPAIGDVFQCGTSCVITWAFYGNGVGSVVNITLLKSGAVISTIATNVPIGNISTGIGAYTWSVPSTVTEGGDYQIRVASVVNSDVELIDSDYFALSNYAPDEPSITVTSPGVVTWRRGNTYAITWNYTGNIGSTVSIRLFKSGIEVGTIIGSTSSGSGGTGSYSWNTNTGSSTGADFNVVVRSLSNSTVQGKSANYFTFIAA
jgi:hypothetical protein